jgi:hypothetical protein
MNESHPHLRVAFFSNVHRNDGNRTLFEPSSPLWQQCFPYLRRDAPGFAALDVEQAPGRPGRCQPSAVTTVDVYVPDGSEAVRFPDMGKGIGVVSWQGRSAIVYLVPEYDPCMIGSERLIRQHLPMCFGSLLYPAYIDHVVDMPQSVYVARPDLQRPSEGLPHLLVQCRFWERNISRCGPITPFAGAYLPYTSEILPVRRLKDRYPHPRAASERKIRKNL